VAKYNYCDPTNGPFLLPLNIFFVVCATNPNHLFYAAQPSSHFPDIFSLFPASIRLFTECVPFQIVAIAS